MFALKNQFCFLLVAIVLAIQWAPALACCAGPQNTCECNEPFYSCNTSTPGGSCDRRWWLYVIIVLVSVIPELICLWCWRLKMKEKQRRAEIIARGGDPDADDEEEAGRPAVPPGMMLVPVQMAPGQGMPGQMMPGQTMPGQMAPGQMMMMPGQMMPVVDNPMRGAMSAPAYGMPPPGQPHRAQ